MKKTKKFFFSMIYWFVTNNFSWLLSCYAGIADHKTLDLFLKFRSLISWPTWTFLPFYCLFGFTSLGKNQNPAKGPVFKPQVVRISFKGIFFLQISMACSLFKSDRASFFRRSSAGIFILATISTFTKSAIICTQNIWPPTYLNTAYMYVYFARTHY